MPLVAEASVAEKLSQERTGLTNGIVFNGLLRNGAGSLAGRTGPRDERPPHTNNLQRVSCLPWQLTARRVATIVKNLSFLRLRNRAPVYRDV